jgi:DNA-binding LacI/PurR family transcriptional regulator
MKLPEGIPIYEGIKRELRRRIEAGELTEGARVPSEYELAKQLGVSRNQTRQALRDLELEGYLVRQQGSGSYVAPQRQWQGHNSESLTFAIAVPDFRATFTHDIIEGFIHRAMKDGANAMTYHLGFNEEIEMEFLRDMHRRGIRGVALWAQHDDPTIAALLSDLKKSEFPVVLIDHYLSSAKASYVASDNEEIGLALTRALLDRGHERIAFVDEKPYRRNTSTADRLTGYQKALTAAGIDPDPRMIVQPPEGGDEAWVVAKDLMAYRSPPTAVVCVNEYVTLRLHEALRRLDYRVPQDVEIGFVDGNHTCETNPIPSIVAEQSGHDIGLHCAELLLALARDPARPDEHRIVRSSISFYDGAPAAQGAAAPLAPEEA